VRRTKKLLVRASQTPELMNLGTSGESSASLSPDTVDFPEDFVRDRSGSGSGLDVLANVASHMAAKP